MFLSVRFAGCLFVFVYVLRFLHDIPQVGMKKKLAYMYLPDWCDMKVCACTCTRTHMYIKLKMHAHLHACLAKGSVFLTFQNLSSCDYFSLGLGRAAWFAPSPIKLYLEFGNMTDQMLLKAHFCFPFLIQTVKHHHTPNYLDVLVNLWKHLKVLPVDGNLAQTTLYPKHIQVVQIWYFLNGLLQMSSLW